MLLPLSPMSFAFLGGISFIDIASFEWLLPFGSYLAKRLLFQARMCITSNNALIISTLMLRCLSLGLLATALVIFPLPLRAQADHNKQRVFYIECSGRKTQGSGAATGFPMNHPILVQYKLDQNASTLTEIAIDTRELTAGQKPIPVQLHGKVLITEFRNRILQKDYEIQIRGDERLFSITVFPPSRIDPDAWYGQCNNIKSP